MSRVTCMIRADQASDFLDTLVQDGPEAAVRSYSQGAKESSLSQTPARDPRRFGKTGAYPRVGKQTPDTLLDRLDREVGVFSALVDQVAEDTWAEGFKLQTDDESYVEAVEQAFEDLCIQEALEEADRFSIYQKDGYAFLYWNLADATGEPSQAPSKVREVLRVQVIPAERVQSIKENTDSEDPKRVGQVEEATINFGGTKTNQKVHWERLTLIRERPILGESAKGKSRAKPWLDDVLFYENIKWASAESFTQRAAPYLQAVLNPEAKLRPEDAKKIKGDIDKLQSGVIQKILAEGFELKPVQGASSIVSPLPYLEGAKDALAASSRIPKHLIFGSAAGELASSKEDTRRYHSRISRRQQRYAKKIILEVLERLGSWGVLPDMPEDLVVTWRPLDEPTFEELTEGEKKRGEAIAVYRNNGVRPPASLVDYDPGDPPLDETDEPEPPAGQPPEEPLAPQDPSEPEGPGEEDPGLVVVFAPEADGVLRKHHLWTQHTTEALPPEARIENPELKPVRLRGQISIQEAFLEWQDAYLAIFEGDERLNREQIDPDDEVVQRVLGLQLDEENLQAVLFTLLEEAARVGGGETFDALGLALPEEFLTETDIRTFRTLSGTLSDSQRARITEQIRRSIADGLSSGEGLRQLRRRVLDQFDIAVRNAERIARTEAMRGFNLGSRAALRQAGQTRFEFQAFDAACPICAPLDGKTFQLEDADAMPPLHPNCRCQMLVVETDVTG